MGYFCEGQKNIIYSSEGADILVRWELPCGNVKVFHFSCFFFLWLILYIFIWQEFFTCLMKVYKLFNSDLHTYIFYNIN